jgi:predicted outer membrane repeat protein
VADCAFTENDSTPSYSIVEAPYGMGAAIAIKNSEQTEVARCTFQSNTAYMGAGIFAAESDLTVDNSRFYSNDVDSKATVGAALVRKILETSLTVIVLDAQDIVELLTNYALTAATCPDEFASEFTKGTGRIGGEGGGIYAVNTRLEVGDSLFSGNNAEKLGAGIYVAGNYAKTTEIKNSTFIQISVPERRRRRQLMRAR